MRTGQGFAIWFPAIKSDTGSDVYTVRLVRGLLKRGIRAEICWLPGRAEYVPWTVPVRRVPKWAGIVHVNTWLHSRFIPGGLPVVSTIHHCVHDPELEKYKTLLQSLYHRLWIRRIEKKVIDRSERVIAVSLYTASKAYALFGCQQKVDVIHNGIDLDVFRPVERVRPNRPFRLLYVGNLSLRKGADLLYPIMKKLGSGFELWYTTGRSRAIRSDLPNMKCLGRVTSTRKLVRIYQYADGLLFPTRLEGFGLAALEAQACGVPVVSTRCSSLPEVVEDGVTGILCPPDNVEAFVEAVLSLAEDRNRWRDMRYQARMRAEKRFSVEDMVEKYIRVYQAVLSGNSCPSW